MSFGTLYEFLLFLKRNKKKLVFFSYSSNPKSYVMCISFGEGNKEHGKRREEKGMVNSKCKIQHHHITNFFIAQVVPGSG